MIGVKNGVEIFPEELLLIFPGNRYVSGDEIQVHFENISFVKGAGQIKTISGITVIFYRCKFSNNRKACNDYPRCKGAQGCKNPNPNGCLTQFEQFNITIGTGYFNSGVGGNPALC